MTAREKPEKKKTAKSKAGTESERLRPDSDRLERRLRAAKPDKSSSQSQSVSMKELSAAARSAKSKFTMAAVEVVEYDHIERTKSLDQAEKLAHAVEKEIRLQLRQEDLVAYSGQGKFFIYLPDTGKVEATMVLERLSHHITKRNQWRSIAPQISISFRLVDVEMAKDAGALQTSKEKDSFANWLQRYQFNAADVRQTNWHEVKAKDKWNHSQNVLLRRFDFPRPSFSAEKRMLQMLSSIQTNGLSLFPKLLDYHSGDGFLCLVLEPFIDCRETAYISQSIKCSHNILISICDLYVQLEGFDIPPPAFKSGNFFIAKNDADCILDFLDKHLITAVQNEVSWTSHVEEKANVLQMIGEFAKIQANDACFSTAKEHLEKATSKKALIAAVQKIRALLKRHEERIRRTLTGESKVSD